MNPVVLCGSATDSHIQAIAERLRQLNHKPFLLDPFEFPAKLKITLGENLADISINGENYSKPQGVYLRSLHQSPTDGAGNSEQNMAQNWRQTLLMYRERNALLEALLYRWEALEVPIYNAPSTSRNITKPLQIALLAKAGLPVSETIWTNDPNAVTAFSENQQLIFKPVTGGANTRILEPKDLTSERLAKLSAAPVTFQRLLPGEDIRVYVLDGRVIASFYIETEKVDYRQNEQQVINWDIDEVTAAQCIKACEVLGLRFSGIDLKRSAEGDLKILELNPSPMFLGFDARTGSDLAGSLASALLEENLN